MNKCIQIGDFLFSVLTHTHWTASEFFFESCKSCGWVYVSSFVTFSKGNKVSHKVEVVTVMFMWLWEHTGPFLRFEWNVGRWNRSGELAATGFIHIFRCMCRWRISARMRADPEVALSQRVLMSRSTWDQVYAERRGGSHGRSQPGEQAKILNSWLVCVTCCDGEVLSSCIRAHLDYSIALCECIQSPAFHN